jgi:hypothetical protein
VTNHEVAALLAKQMSVGCLLLGSRQWITMAHFQLFDRVQDAFRLIQKAASGFSVTKTPSGVFTAIVQVGDRAGTACGRAEAAAISLVTARAIGVHERGDH